MSPDPPQPPALNLALDGVEIVQTSLDDGLVQSGEAVKFDVFVTNRSSTAYTALYVSSEGGEIFLSGTLGSGLIDRFEPGQTLRFQLRHDVPPNTLVGTRIAVPITFEVQRGQPAATPAEFTTDLTTSPLPYDPSVSGVSVTSDTDRDGRVEPGEEATVSFMVGFSRGGSESTCLGNETTSSLAQVTLLGGNLGCNPPGQRSFTFRASSLLTPGTTLPFVVRLRDRLSNTYDFPVSLPLG